MSAKYRQERNKTARHAQGHQSKLLVVPIEWIDELEEIANSLCLGLTVDESDEPSVIDKDIELFRKIVHAWDASEP